MFKVANKNIIQSKLTIGQPNDRYEQEADRVADQVMKMSANTAQPIQRKCADCEEEELQMKPLSATISPIIQKKPNGETVQMEGLSSSLQQSKGGGQPIDGRTQSLMSKNIGADFSNVKIHTDHKAVQMNRQLNAKAFTNGTDVYFNQGQYNPQSSEGKHLLAHELTHVVQQNGSSKNIQRSFKDDGQQETCGGAITCSRGTDCEIPDNPEDGPFASEPGATSGMFRLTIRIDTAVNTVHDIDEGSDVGHTYVLFTDPSGAEYSYGFYPSPSSPTPDPSGIMGSRTAPGCVVHPDVTHIGCVDYDEVFLLSPEQYYAALQAAQDSCKHPANYHTFTHNCTSWAGTIANAAGQSLPNMRESVHVPLAGSHEADNPNTLLDSLRERDNEANIQRKCNDGKKEEIQRKPINDIIQLAPLPKKDFESVDYTLKRYISEVNDHLDNGRTKEAKAIAPKIISYATSVLAEMHGLEAAKALFRLGMTDDAFKVLNEYTKDSWRTSHRGTPSKKAAQLIYEEGKKAYAANDIDKSFELYQKLFHWLERNELLGSVYDDYKDTFTEEMYPKVIDALLSIPEYYKTNGETAKQKVAIKEVKQLILKSPITDRYAHYAAEKFVKLGQVNTADELLKEGQKKWQQPVHGANLFPTKSIQLLTRLGNEALTANLFDQAFTLFLLAIQYIKDNQKAINHADLSALTKTRAAIDKLYYDAINGLFKIVDQSISLAEQDLKSGAATATTHLAAAKKWLTKIQSSLSAFKDHAFIIAKVDKDPKDNSKGVYQDANDSTTTMKVTTYDEVRSPMDELLNPIVFNDRLATLKDMISSKTNQIKNIKDFYDRDKAIVALFKTKHGRDPDIHNLADRKLFWDLKYDNLIAKKMNKEAALEILITDIEAYLQAFSIHSAYNIPDAKTDVISGDYPKSITGQALKDCGIFAMQVAYELSLIKDKAQIDFYFVSVPIHVYLGIIDRAQNFGWSVNNNSIVKIDHDIKKEGVGSAVITSHFTTFTSFDVKKIDSFSEKGLVSNFKNIPNTLFLPKNYKSLSSTKRKEADALAKVLKKVYLQQNKLNYEGMVKSYQLLQTLKAKYDSLPTQDAAAKERFNKNAKARILKAYPFYQDLTKKSNLYFKEIQKLEKSGDEVTTVFHPGFYVNMWTMMRWVIYVLGEISYETDDAMTSPAYAHPDTSYKGVPVPWEKLNITLPKKNAPTTNTP